MWFSCIRHLRMTLNRLPLVSIWPNNFMTFSILFLLYSQYILAVGGEKALTILPPRSAFNSNITSLKTHGFKGSFLCPGTLPLIMKQNCYFETVNRKGSVLTRTNIKPAQRDGQLSSCKGSCTNFHATSHELHGISECEHYF